MLEGLFDEPEIHVASAAIEDRTDLLFPEELASIHRASAARRAEFSTGRWLARKLLSELGCAPVAIPRGRDRSPRWPCDWVGSITHSGRACAAAVASASRYRGIGIDLEPDEAVKPGLERLICFGDELDWVAAAGEGERGRRCRMVFSVKEAVYKAFHPHTGRVWRFADVALEIDLASESFHARLPADAGTPAIEGRVLRRRGWITSGVAWACALPPDDSRGPDR